VILAAAARSEASAAADGTPLANRALTPSPFVCPSGACMVRLYGLSRWNWLFALALLSLSRLASASHADLVEVEAQSGRVFVGQIDGNTNSQVLYLRSGTSDMHLVRPIDWRAIVRVRVNGQLINPDELLRRFESGGRDDVTEELPQPQASDAPPQGVIFQPSPGMVSLPVTALVIEASTGKWTSGAEQSGLLVRIYPLDGYGEIVPVDGLLEIDLIGQERAWLTHGEPFPPLGRWSVQVHPEDFGSNGAVFRLPYQAWNPEFDLQLGSSGAVHARLTVPGQGVFDDTATMVTLRPFSTTRDRWQIFSGERFFPQERTHRGVGNYGPPH
jgi:hypothetical protein